MCGRGEGVCGKGKGVWSGYMWGGNDIVLCIFELRNWPREPTLSWLNRTLCANKNPD